MPYRGDSSWVVLFDVGTEGSITGISPASQSHFSFAWLHITHLFSEVVKAERQIVAGVQETPLAQVTMLCDQDLKF